MRTALLFCSAVICCCAVLAWQPGDAQAKSSALDGTERKVVRLVNRIRAHHGLRRLRASRTLARAANNHTSDILRTNVLSHASADGTPMATRVRRYTGADWVGENVAAVWGRGSSARKVVRMWMNSPSHRAVLMSAAAGRVGVGRNVGMFAGSRRAIFTADFASRH
jgi:uncharacterized protein YkwD